MFIPAPALSSSMNAYTTDRPVFDRTTTAAVVLGSLLAPVGIAAAMAAPLLAAGLVAAIGAAAYHSTRSRSEESAAISRSPPQVSTTPSK